MKKLIFLFAYFFFFLFAGKLFAVNDSCLKMVLPDDGKTGFNPDSVMTDTCTNSPAYGKWYARQTFFLITAIYIFPQKPVPIDERKTWKDIDSSLTTTKLEFQQLEQIFGPCNIRRDPKCTNDSAHLNIKTFFVQFENYVQVDSVLAFINSIMNVNSSYLLNRPEPMSALEDSPNRFGIKISEDMLILSILDNQLSDKSIHIKIFDIFGNYVYENRIFEEPQKISIDISHLSSGIYFIGINEKTYKFSVVR